MTAVLTIWILSKKKENLIKTTKENFWKLVLAGLIYSLAGFFVYSGFAAGTTALVSVVKKVQVVMVLILSFILFKDKPTKSSIIGTIIMLIGIVMVKIF